jgi:multidrug efflux pump subunit AcrA (membrane-fusion protein)
MTANVRVIVEELEEVVSIPLECVFEREDRRLVYVRRGQDFLPLEVELDEQSEDMAVVIKGLQGGEEIALRSVGDERSLAEPPSVPASSSPIVPQGGAQ